MTNEEAARGQHGVTPPPPALLFLRPEDTPARRRRFSLWRLLTGHLD